MLVVLTRSVGGGGGRLASSEQDIIKAATHTLTWVNERSPRPLEVIASRFRPTSWAYAGHGDAKSMPLELGRQRQVSRDA